MVLVEAVGDLIQEVARDVIMPRFRRLAAGEVRIKSPGEEVTVADEDAERLITSRLLALVPGSTVIGEEAASRRPDLLEAVGDAVVWLVDPLDGTSNFVAGEPCFSTMVCLLREGEAVASWMLSPARAVLHVAEKGAGAWIDGQPARVGSTPPWDELSGAILTRFLPADIQVRLRRATAGIQAVLPGLRCAGEEYPSIVEGRHHFAVFWRALPWDHAGGGLFLTEAGGALGRFDGRPYRPTEPGPGLLAAQTPALWAELRTRFFADLTELG